MKDVEMSVGHLDRILAHFDVGEIQELQRIPHGYVNEHWLVKTTNGAYCLKRRHPSLRRPSVIRGQHLLIDHLRLRGFPAPTLVATREGMTFLPFEGEIYELQIHHPGAHGDVDNPLHTTAAARCLGRYHRLAAGFDHPALHPAQERYGPARLGAILDRLRGKANLSRWLGAVEEHARDLALRFEKAQGLPELVIHGDYYAENLLFQGDNLVCVLDYDLAHWAARAVEVAEALIYFATKRPGSLQEIVYCGVLDLDSVRGFLQAYLEIAELREAEIRALPHFIRTIWLCASLDPPLGPPLDVETAPQALPEILILADWARANESAIVEIGLDRTQEEPSL